MSSQNYFFDSPGPKNTECVIEAVQRRVSLGGIEAVIVASTSGISALKFARGLAEELRSGKVKVVCVSEPPSYSEVAGRWPTMDASRSAELAKLGVRVINDQPYAFHNSITGEKPAPATPEKILRAFLEKGFGSGMKVAVECVLMATTSGAVPPFKTVIGVGGAHSGADTAIVARSSFTNRMLSDELEKCFTVMEILAMPKRKY